MNKKNVFLLTILMGLASGLTAMNEGRPNPNFESYTTDEYIALKKQFKRKNLANNLTAIEEPKDQNLNDICNDNKQEIFSFLPFRDRCQLRGASKEFETLTTDGWGCGEIKITPQTVKYLDKILNSINKFKKLTYTIVSSTLRNKKLEQISTNNTLQQNLTTLNLSGCNNITDEGLQQLTQLKNLTTLDLSGCKQITDGGLNNLAQLTKLTTLDLCGCELITNAGLNNFAQLTKLTTLNLCNCYKITDAGFKSLRLNLPNIKIQY
jgi:hypothetical protein